MHLKTSSAKMAAILCRPQCVKRNKCISSKHISGNVAPTCTRSLHHHATTSSFGSLAHADLNKLNWRFYLLADDVFKLFSSWWIPSKFYWNVFQMVLFIISLHVTFYYLVMSYGDILIKIASDYGLPSFNFNQCWLVFLAIRAMQFHWNVYDIIWQLHHVFFYFEYIYQISHLTMSHYDFCEVGRRLPIYYRHSKCAARFHTKSLMHRISWKKTPKT